jgi:plastocyanin
MPRRKGSEMNRKLALVMTGLLLLSLIAFAGCGKKTQTTTPKVPSTPKTTPGTTPSTTSGNTVTAKNFSFDPQELTVTAGTEVTFKNEDSVTHTFTGTDFDSGDIQPGGEFKHTFATAGSYDYHCSIHPSMTGKIVVK